MPDRWQLISQLYHAARERYASLAGHRLFGRSLVEG
jgi:hypothetical protein